MWLWIRIWRTSSERSAPIRGWPMPSCSSGPCPTRPSGTGWKLVARVDPLTPHQRDKRADIESQIKQIAGDATIDELLVRAKNDPELKELVNESFANVDQPVLYLWYRPLEQS